MSTRYSHISPSAREAECPECGKRLSRRSDIKRHRRTQHPDGTEFKSHCPYPGCEFKTAQKSNLRIHMNSRHSNEYRYPCLDCGKGFTDPAARIRHRKATHGYQPYHTPRYYARRALKEAEKRAKGDLTKTGTQKAAIVVPPSTQSASSSSSSSAADSQTNLLANTTYHNDFWKLLVNVPRRDALEPTFSQDAQINSPVADSDLSLPKVETSDGFPLCGYQLDTIVRPQSQAAFDQSWAAYGQTIPGPASDQLSIPATFPTLSEQSTYPGTIFQSLPTFSFTKDPSSLPNSFDSPSSSSSSSFAHISGPQFIPHDYIPTPSLFEPVPILGWAPTSSLLVMTETELFTGGQNGGFNTWYESNSFS